MSIEKPYQPSPEEIKKAEYVINDSVLMDLYRHADDAGRYKSRDLDSIKRTAEEISQTLYELGATNLSPDSKLGEAYLSAKKINDYTDVDSARSVIQRIAYLIHDSDGFEQAKETWVKSNG